MNYLYLAPISAFVFASIQGIIEIFFKDKISRKKLVSFMIILYLATAVVGVIIIFQNEEDVKYSKYSGQISGELRDKSIIYPVVKVGNASFIYSGKTGNPLFVFGEDPLKVWIEDGQLKISTTIRDETGKIVANIEANEWQVSQNRDLVYDRNFDKKAIEVIDAKGNVILQAQFDGEAVQIAGIFSRGDGWRVAVGPAEAVGITEGGGVFVNIPPNGTPPAFKPLFKYPSDEHKGERLK